MFSHLLIDEMRVMGVTDNGYCNKILHVHFFPVGHLTIFMTRWTGSVSLLKTGEMLNNTPLL